MKHQLTNKAFSVHAYVFQVDSSYEAYKLRIVCISCLSPACYMSRPSHSLHDIEMGT